jgi:hypothetical protein
VLPLVLVLSLFGGISGAVLVISAYYKALIFLSSAAGYLLIAQSLPIEGMRLHLKNDFGAVGGV